MKRIFAVLILIPLLVALVACSNATTTATATETSTLSEEGQLLVGSLDLETTNLAVTAEQAAKLLPLWETLQSLASSGTAATQEVDAVIGQIKNTMTSEQLASITAMNLTKSDLQAAISANGATSAASTSLSTTNSSSVQMPPGVASAGTNDGGAGGGTPPTDMGGSGGMAASVGVNAGTVLQASSTQSASSSASSSANEVPAALINALVQLLQKKAG